MLFSYVSPAKACHGDPTKPPQYPIDTHRLKRNTGKGKPWARHTSVVPNPGRETLALYQKLQVHFDGSLSSTTTSAKARLVCAADRHLEYGGASTDSSYGNFAAERSMAEIVGASTMVQSKSTRPQKAYNSVQAPLKRKRAKPKHFVAGPAGVGTGPGIGGTCKRNNVTHSLATHRKRFKARNGPMTGTTSRNVSSSSSSALSPSSGEARKEIQSREKTAAKASIYDEEDPETYAYDRNMGWCGKCGNAGDLLCCDTCSNAYHTTCIGITKVPDGDWSCPWQVLQRLQFLPHAHLVLFSASPVVVKGVFCCLIFRFRVTPSTCPKRRSLH